MHSFDIPIILCVIGMFAGIMCMGNIYPLHAFVVGGSCVVAAGMMLYRTRGA